MSDTGFSTEFKLARVTREELDAPLALVTIDNGADHTRPTVFGRTAFDSLDRVLHELEGADWAGLVVTGKPYFFSAGADIDEFPLRSTPELAREGSRAGHELFARVAALQFPTVAAINGACLGGGVELALHCDARTISTAVRHFACPECFLGIIPGWGGTQLVPRLLGVETAVQFIVTNPMRQNRMLDGRRAHELGFADRLLEPPEFVDESIAFAIELTQLGPTSTATPADETAADVIAKARAQLDDSTHGAAPAPYRALDLIEGAASGWTLEQGYRAEEDTIAELLPGRQAQASIYAFDLAERRAKQPPPFVGRDGTAIRKVGLVGGGLMATQIGGLIVTRLQLPLVVRELDEALVDRALAAVRGAVDERVAKGRVTEGHGAFLKSIVTGSTEYGALADCDLVLEAVFEDLALKQQVFAELEAVVSADTVLATNTSALSVTSIAADLERPERVVGMHFFNPVALLPLVELVHGERTDEATLASAWEIAVRLRKRPVLVADAPGFVVNRILTRLLTVVLGALERGNSVEEADRAILRLGLPMAPSVLLQVVGPRVALHVLETLHDAYPDRFALSQTLTNYAEGREEIATGDHDPLSEDELLDNALEAIADEVRHLLEEGVVPDAKDIDTALILGAGFPFWLGGITKFLDQTGVSERMFGHALAEVGAGARA